MWMLPRVGNGARDPLKHVVNIKPSTTLDVDISADAEGGWSFHCHLLYHMEAGICARCAPLSIFCDAGLGANGHGAW